MRLGGPRGPLGSLLAAGVFASVALGCGSLFPEKSPPARAPADVKTIAFDIVAEGSRCEPDVIAIDRQGRAVLVKLHFASRGGKHVIAIPDLDIRKTLEAGDEATVEFIADRSEIYSFTCGSTPFALPFQHKGKIAVK